MTGSIACISTGCVLVLAVIVTVVRTVGMGVCASCHCHHDRPQPATYCSSYCMGGSAQRCEDNVHICSVATVCVYYASSLPSSFLAGRLKNACVLCVECGQFFDHGFSKQGGATSTATLLLVFRGHSAQCILGSTLYS